MTDKVDLPKNATVATRVIDAQSKERGMLGHIFGTKEHAPTNIAAVSVILLIAILGILLMAPLADGVDRGAIITALLSAITFVLGLLFGRGSS